MTAIIMSKTHLLLIKIFSKREYQNKHKQTDKQQKTNNQSKCASELEYKNKKNLVNPH